MIENVNTVVFDLDGTLLRTESIIVGAIQSALARTSAKFRVDVRQPSQREILSLVGTPVYEFADRLRLPLADDALAFFRAELEEEELRQIEDGQARLFEGVSELLADLRNSGFGLALISNCSRRYLMAVCDYFSLWDYFNFSLCAEDIPRSGKARLLQEILEKTETLPGEAIYIGDRASDLEAARAIRCGFIGCLWGYGKGEFDDSVPTLASIDELAAVLSQIRTART
ncbi:MAG TPA: HAD family hydrolase [Acidobacteriota bacterium]|jgi:HAD superfamily hydrolase (TIGR01549 family)